MCVDLLRNYHIRNANSRSKCRKNELSLHTDDPPVELVLFRLAIVELHTPFTHVGYAQLCWTLICITNRVRCIRGVVFEFRRSTCATRLTQSTVIALSSRARWKRFFLFCFPYLETDQNVKLSLWIVLRPFGHSVVLVAQFEQEQQLSLTKERVNLALCFLTLAFLHFFVACVVVLPVRVFESRARCWHSKHTSKTLLDFLFFSRFKYFKLEFQFRLHLFSIILCSTLFLYLSFAQFCQFGFAFPNQLLLDAMSFEICKSSVPY